METEEGASVVESEEGAKVAQAPELLKHSFVGGPHVVGKGQSATPFKLHSPIHKRSVLSPSVELNDCNHLKAKVSRKYPDRQLKLF